MLTDLRQVTPGTRINWSEFARNQGINAKNGGQVVKEFAKKHGIDTFSLDGRPDIPRNRARKRKLPGDEISIPTMPTVNEIKQEQQKLISDGEIIIGELCTPFPHTNTSTHIG